MVCCTGLSGKLAVLDGASEMRSEAVFLFFDLVISCKLHFKVSDSIDASVDAAADT